MIHLDLFSGIGGFALAVDTVWPGAEHIFCEIDPFCQAVLRKNFGKEIMIYGDIRTLTADAISSNGGRESDGRVQNKGREAGKGGREGIQPKDRPTRSDNAKSSLVVIANSESGQSGEPTEQKGREDTGRGSFQVDLLTGGFPCQPFSQAGKRKGKSDDRWLWPEMLRVIREFQPTWIIGENVNGLVSMAQRQGESALDSAIGDEIKNDEDGTADGVLCEILDALEQVGYAVQAFIIPACGVGAPHRRDRVWIVAHREEQPKRKQINAPKSFSQGRKTREEFSGGDRGIEFTQDASGQRRRGRGDGNTGGLRRPLQTAGSDSHAPHAPSNSRGGQGQGVEAEKGLQARPEHAGKLSGRPERPYSDVADSGDPGLQRSEREKAHGERTPAHGPIAERNSAWDENWLDVATRTCVRGVHDGLPVELHGLKLSASRHRVERLKALGNAIVPQVVIEIMYGIKNFPLTKQR